MKVPRWVRPAATKFHVPPVSSGFVERPGLTALLGDEAQTPVVLVRGLPGSGRTSLLAHWVRGQPDVSVVWISCDEDDAEPAVLWHSFISALQQLPDIDHRLLDLLAEPDWTPSAMTGVVVNELLALESPVVIVLDDAHRAGEALSSLTPFLERLPQRTRVVLSTTRALPLPVQRMRIRGQLTEVGQDTLRLSEAEAAAIVAGFGPKLSAEQLRLLAERSEGWVAAVVLAVQAIGAGGAPDLVVADLLRHASCLGEFFRMEVLDGVDADLEHFLLDVAHLDRLDPSACVVASQRDDAVDLLARAAYLGLFVVAEAGGYRFHPLFGEFLACESRDRDPSAAANLHRRMAAWRESEGDVAGAVRHLVQAGGFPEAAVLAGRSVLPAYWSGGQPALDALVAELEDGAADDPTGMAQCVQVFSALLDGRIDACRRWLARASRRPVDLVGSAAGMLSLAEGSVVRDSIPADTDPALAAVLTLVSCAWLGDAVGAGAAYDGYLAGVGRTAMSDLMLSAEWSYACAISGDLDEALAATRRTRACLDEVAVSAPVQAAVAQRAQGLTHYERGDLQRAGELFEESLRVTQRYPSGAFLGHLLLARTWLAQGRLREVGDGLARARAALPAGRPSPLLDLAASLEVRLMLAEGDVNEAAHAAGRISESRRQAACRARVALVAGDARRAADAMLPAGTGTTVRQRLDTAILLARIDQRLGRVVQAQERVDIAVAQAADGGWVRPFLEDGPELFPLIRSSLQGMQTSAFTVVLLDELRDAGAAVRRGETTGGLSKREVAVLRLLAGRSNNQEIAAELYISVNTLKTHTRRLYRKLGVGSRPDAVEAARRLGLFPSTPEAA